MTALQTIEWENAQFDVDEIDVDAPPADIGLTVTQAAAWERICARVFELVADADREEFPSYVGIVTREPRVRLQYTGDSAAITVPYSYDGDKAMAALATAYAVGRVVEEETDLVGVDSQTTAGLAIEHLDAALSVYTGTRTSALRSIREIQ